MLLSFMLSVFILPLLSIPVMFSRSNFDSSSILNPFDRIILNPGGRSQTGLAKRYWARGSITLKVEPSPGALLIFMSPP
jgi:hypothetical protein